jgi:hypothetical protein
MNPGRYDTVDPSKGTSPPPSRNRKMTAYVINGIFAALESPEEA